MQHFATLGHLLGGIGIFLLAISLLTRGLKSAGSEFLRRMMAKWTKTPLHGLGLGLGVTAILQSSSATTVIVLGLVNAAILTIGQAIWVIMGSNIGTTLTGWIVTVVGLDFDIKPFALPLIGIGMLAQVFIKSPRADAFALALTGFGLFFLGIDILKDAFAGYADQINLQDINGKGGFYLIMMFLVGFAATVATQSSSAAVALILTGTAGGLIGLPEGAAMVIGANLGTSTTAVLVVIGAEPDARRAASAHVLFNLITGIVALAILPLMLKFIAEITQALDLPASDTVSLALFHTVFNVMGVMLLSPFVPMLTRFLERSFMSAEEEEGRPRYLDDTTLHIPAMALDALVRELGRLQNIAARAALAVIVDTHDDDFHADVQAAIRYRAALAKLSARIDGFADALAQQRLPDDTLLRLQYALRVNRYLHEFVRLSGAVEALVPLQEKKKLPPSLLKENRQFLDRCIKFLTLLEERKPLPKTALALLKKDGGSLKDALLKAGVRKAVSVSELSALLDAASHARRMMEQAIKSQRYLKILEDEQQNVTEEKKPETLPPVFEIEEAAG
ncbi:MAG: Na/Pi cotransporter family protein [Pseudomonadota bacterium]|nr:Na/Pi cotransporter family protein [Pseudomonadota bacterium]QKK06161.1 MAG: Na/Pi cotransporter family protein [Pseudomonadota bacterium]